VDVRLYSKRNSERTKNPLRKACQGQSETIGSRDQDQTGEADALQANSRTRAKGYEIKRDQMGIPVELEIPEKTGDEVKDREEKHHKQLLTSSSRTVDARRLRDRYTSLCLESIGKRTRLRPET